MNRRSEGESVDRRSEGERVWIGGVKERGTIVDYR